jgi:hypothetical protein
MSTPVARRKREKRERERDHIACTIYYIVNDDKHII